MADLSPVPSAESWIGFSGSAGATASKLTATLQATGAFSLDLAIASTDANSFSGAFQDIDVASLIGTRSYLYRLAPAHVRRLRAEANIRIEWRDGRRYGTLANRSSLRRQVRPTRCSAVSGNVPVGTDFRRADLSEPQFSRSAVLSSKTFTSMTSLTFDVVPEPSSVALLGLSALGLITRRRR